MPFRDLLSLFKLSPAVSTDERRETVRLRCRLDILLWVGDDIHMASVVDVALTGLCLEVERPLKVGQSVSLARDDFGHPWEGHVLWCRSHKTGRGYRVGVKYPPDEEMLRSSWLEPALKQTGFKIEEPGEKRELRRVSGRVRCQVKGLTGEVYTDAEMLDLSLGGAKLETPMAFHEGLKIEFETWPRGGLPPLKGLAKILKCVPREDGRWWCSLKFTESKKEDVQKYMASMLGSSP